MYRIPVFLFILCLSTNRLSAQLSINAAASPVDMVNTLSGGGVSVFNISYSGAAVASSTFTCTGNCNLAISEGVILTSGDAQIAANPNVGTGQGIDNGALGDPMLESLTTGTIFNAAILEFDFFAIADSVEFNYIFASEEYNDYVNANISDVFGFFISGPGITGSQNIALIPGTNSPVTINNVNNGNSAPWILATGPCENCAYYNDNTQSTFTTAYDGLTTVLTAAARVQPGSVYHLKIGIGDSGDGVFDSGVFLEAGTFHNATDPVLYVNGNRISGNTVHICQGNTVSLSAPAGFQYLWSTGSTNQAIDVSGAGSYSVTIFGSNPGAPVSSPLITFIVDSNTIPVPVLSYANSVISSSVDSASYSYSWTFNGLPIPGEFLPVISPSQNGCYAITVTDIAGCTAVSDSLCVFSLGIPEHDNADLKLFPNPFDQNTTLSFNNPLKLMFTLQIMDITGKELRTIANNFSDQITISKESLTPGIYLFALRSQDGNFFYNGKFFIK